jgi:hypothetical protein
VREGSGVFELFVGERIEFVLDETAKPKQKGFFNVFFTVEGKFHENSCFYFSIRF